MVLQDDYFKIRFFLERGDVKLDFYPAFIWVGFCTKLPDFYFFWRDGDIIWRAHGPPCLERLQELCQSLGLPRGVAN